MDFQFQLQAVFKLNAAYKILNLSL
jgi:hypothetical protein